MLAEELIADAETCPWQRCAIETVCKICQDPVISIGTNREEAVHKQFATNVVIAQVGNTRIFCFSDGRWV